MLKWQPQIFVVDDNPIVQSAWRNWLNKVPGAEIHMYSDAESFLASFVPGRPGILILDNHMPGMTGMELIERYVPRQIDVPVLMVTAFADVQMAVRAVKTGVVNVLEKPLRGDELLAAVEKILDKEQLDWPRRQEAAELRASLASLTSREREVMMELLEGRSNKDVATNLGISPKTVEIHRARVLQKARVDSVTELVRRMTVLDVDPPGEE